MKSYARHRHRGRKRRQWERQKRKQVRTLSVEVMTLHARSHTRGGEGSIPPPPPPFMSRTQGAGGWAMRLCFCVPRLLSCLIERGRGEKEGCIPFAPPTYLRLSWSHSPARRQTGGGGGGGKQARQGRGTRAVLSHPQSFQVPRTGCAQSRGPISVGPLLCAHPIRK